MTRRAADRLWFGRGALAGAARGALWPAAAAYRVVVGARNALYDAGVLPVHAGAIPAIAVGNLTVGGTGKTPVSAWFAGELARRGARPAIVIRGYGNDEPLVHERLNPAIPVVVGPDRVAGLARARARGATIAVLDDAFQHRRVARLADVVLISADAASGRGEPALAAWRMLPAGPFREPPSGLRRAALVVVTRKMASAADAGRVLVEATAISGTPGAVLHLEPAALESASAGTGGAARTPLSLSALAGRRLVLVTGVGEPALAAAQLRLAGAEVDLRAFPDHHAFSDAELRAAGEAAARADALAVCTLKDAVKIGARWPGPGPLWYVSQRLTVDQGQEHLDRLLDAAAAGTRANPPTAG